jgi:ketosteroid isomerase-like protein
LKRAVRLIAPRLRYPRARLLWSAAGAAAGVEMLAVKEKKMARTPEQVYQHHARALDAGDLDELVADYADDAVLITSAGVKRGEDGIRGGYARIFADLPNATWNLRTQIYEGDLMFVEWAAASASAFGEGVGTFVITDGLIRAQTLHFTVQHRI